MLNQKLSFVIFFTVSIHLSTVNVVVGQLYDDAKYYGAIIVANEEGLTHRCGGAIIHKHVFLTTCRCVYDIPVDEMQVRAGGSRNSDVPHRNTVIYQKVISYICPDEYDPNGTEYDIAVVKIHGSFSLSLTEHFEKLHLPQGGDYAKKWAMVSGYWTLNSDVRKKNVNNINFTSPPAMILSNDECNKIVGHPSDDTLCTEPIVNIKDACFGEIGDPLSYRGEIVGLLREPMCNSKIQPQFTRVSTYEDFIRNMTRLYWLD